MSTVVINDDTFFFYSVTNWIHTVSLTSETNWMITASAMVFWNGLKHRQKGNVGIDEAVRCLVAKVNSFI